MCSTLACIRDAAVYDTSEDEDDDIEEAAGTPLHNSGFAPLPSGDAHGWEQVVPAAFRGVYPAEEVHGQADGAAAANGSQQGAGGKEGEQEQEQQAEAPPTTRYPKSRWARGCVLGRTRALHARCVTQGHARRGVSQRPFDTRNSCGHRYPENVHAMHTVYEP